MLWPVPVRLSCRCVDLLLGVGRGLLGAGILAGLGLGTPGAGVRVVAGLGTGLGAGAVGSILSQPVHKTAVLPHATWWALPTT